ncbi:polymer-forming cytoskeletal protein [Streptomyces sp. 35G-GA-8]|uniref:polymer-forming cytoskeletal protein n=1 Tax=Streptomyces sp. 35G-GA-8 TaxID=2939434 RepID=UPI00201F5F04|nr:polymer-forming cytoskeletal protein [Streptomyces sp. 35G-GA-8]MCL7380050.1 polymer-forming cytoskeletal protein [Streptomyces sp. 35G-GA-8]
MAYLVYDILTDPAPLQVPEAAEISQGAVYIVVSNPKNKDMAWDSITVHVPVGQQADALTPDPKAIRARIEHNNATKPGDEPTAVCDSTTGVCTLTPGPGRVFAAAGSMVLVLEGFPVSSTPGSVLLRMTETVWNGPWKEESPVTLSLLKQAPKVPRNFRPKQSLVAAGTDVVLRWDGPDALIYRIQGPDGPSPSAPQRKTTGWEWSPQPGEEPKRDATYTLIATSPAQQQPGYFLTTTVHLRSPEFESVTATDGVHSPWVEGTTDKGKIYFTAQGAEIRDASNAQGSLTADKAELRDLNTGQAQVKGDLSVNGRVDAGGELHAAQNAVVDGDLTVNGKLELDELLVARTATIGGDLSVNGRVDAGGELHAAQNAVVDGDLTVNGKLELDELLVASKATIGGDLSVNGRADVLGGLRSAGKTVIGDDLTVNGDLDVNGESVFSGKVNANAHLSVRGGSHWILHTNDALISVNGGLRVQEQSLFIGKVNANGHLSVRNGTDKWIMHTNDDLVAVNSNLRVHGAFHSDN